MEFRKILALRGPNIWANFPVLEALVDLGDLKDCSSDEMPGFNDRLKGWLPSLIEHRCSVGERGGFFERLRRGTYLAHILEHVALELQGLAGSPVGFGKARETSEEGVYKVALRFEVEEVGLAAFHAGRELCLAAVHDLPFDVAAAVDRLKVLRERHGLGPSTRAIVAAAKARTIPSRRLNTDSLVRLGWGAKQRRIVAAETSNTGAIAESIAQDKELTRALLKESGIPVAWGRPVDSPEDACEAAEEIGGAVVVKPRYGNHGRGVCVNLTTREQVLSAYELAGEISDNLVVEKFAPGDDYRLLVVDGKLVAAARREPARVVGDGIHSIEELVELVNRDPRRGDGHGSVLTKITIDPLALATLVEQGMTPQSIPQGGMAVLIRRNANLSTGGSATDVTDLVHPEVAARAEDAARVVGLDIAGIDVIAKDITRPLEDQGGIIVEVNAGPGLRMHIEPSQGKPRPVGEAIVNSLFPNGETGRIPLVAVTGVNGKTTVTRLIAHMYRLAGYKVGMTCTDGILVDGQRLIPGDCSGPQSARAVLANPRVEAAILETARGGILREGLGFDYCDVGIVTNIGEGDHLGLNFVDDLEKLAQVKRTVIDAVGTWGTGVLKADDPLTAAMAEYCPGSVTFFCRDIEHTVLREHLAKGGRGVSIRDGMVTLIEGSIEHPFIEVAKVPLTHHGRVGFQVENVLTAVAAAWAMKLDLNGVREALFSFSSDLDTTPGRFNVLHHGGATIIVDYGHNPSALTALGEAIRQFPHERRSIIFTAAGDRRDVDIIRQGEIVAALFDYVILYEDGCVRGRPDGEVTRLVREGLALAKTPPETYETRGEPVAIDFALNNLKPGDLLVIQADNVERTVAHIKAFQSDQANWIRITETDETSEPCYQGIEVAAYSE